MGRQPADRPDPDRRGHERRPGQRQPAATPAATATTSRYCVVAIAAFVITGYTQPAVDQINGRFIGTIPYSVNGNTNVPGGGHASRPRSGSNFYYLGLAQ